jgi:hypothetical protein
MLEMICFALVAIALVAPGLIVPVLEYSRPKAGPVAETDHADLLLTADKQA